MKRPLHLDIESRSEVDLKASGVYVYAEHESTDILVICYAFGDEAVQTWRPGQELPDDIVRHINEGGEIRAHNAQFERVVLNGVAGKRIRFPFISIEQTTCTAAKMAAHGLPRSLADAASALGTIPKDEAGRTTMLQLSKPRRGAVKWYTRENAPEKFAILDAYCKNDVEVERAIDRIVPDLPKSEQEIYWLDQQINDRGVAVDLKAIDDAQYVVDRYKDELHKKCTELTGFAPTQRDKIAEWVRSNGYPQLTDMQAETVRRAVLDPKVPDNCKTALRIFSTYGNKAVSKLEAMRLAVSSNGRLQGMFLYHGAGTGRWSSLKVQLQNLFRGVIPDPEVAIDALSARDLNWIRSLYPGIDPMKVIASCIRGMLIPGDGKILQAIDYAGIESRVNAWLFNEEWKLKAFRDFDKGVGPDLYTLAYARAFRVSLAGVTKQQRQVGKVLELACLGAGTQVLTRSGYKRIVDVSIADEIWDGVEWVKHKGVLAKGVRRVVNVDGIEVTPDHLIATPQTWKPAAELVSNENTRRLALDRGSANLPSLKLAPARLAALLRLFGSSVTAVLRATGSTIITCVKVRQRPVANVPVRRQGIIERGTGVMPILCPTTSIVDGCSTELRLVSVDAQTREPEGTKTTVAEAFEFTRNGRKIDGNFYAICLPWKDGIIRSWTWIVSMLTGTMNRATYGSLPEKKTATTGAPSRNSKNKFENWKPVYDLVNAGPRSRFTVKTNTGHLLVHNCGYEGGVGAFVTMADTYSLELEQLAAAAFPALSPETLQSAAWMWNNFAIPKGRTYDLPEKVYLVCESLKQLWRATNPRIVSGWTILKEAAIKAVENPGGVYGLSDKKVLFRKVDEWLYLRLPSGRRLAYYQPEIHGETLTYMGVDTATRRWMRTSSYGGKWDENCCQAIARDILVSGMLALEKNGYPVVATVHDEAVSEIEEGFGSVEEAGRLMCQAPDWAEGLPLAVEGWRAKRFRK